MRMILLAALITFVAPVLSLAQDAKQTNSPEQEIRRLDKVEVDAVLRKDVATLEKLWAEDFTVNNPRSEITNGRKEVVGLIRNGVIDYSSFVRDVERVLIHGDTVILMGLETVKPTNKAPLAGQTVRRRFTNIWMKRNGEWRLTARHANMICGN